MTASNIEPNRLSASEAARRIAAGELTSEALVRACLERIATREDAVQAWVALDAEAAIAEARRLDQGPRRGMLHGLPIGVKDVIDTLDLPTEYGSPIYRGHRPAWDAACVAMARAAGALVLGKTVTTEFATAHPGKTRNPHDPAHTPGGSSSGSAAAVADGMVPLAFGTQTGGSVIRPASFCGVVGFKPSYGTINIMGVRPVSDALDTIGTMGRTVDDAALLAAAAAGRPDLATPAEFARPRVGIWRGVEWSEAKAEMVAAIEAAAKSLAHAGCEVREIAIPPEFATLGEAHHEIEYFELARAFAHEMRFRRELISESLRSRIDHGNRCPFDVYRDKLAHAMRCRTLLAEVFANVDCLLTPSATGAAPAGLASTGSAIFNRCWTLLEAPCVTLPRYAADNGLPVGVQLVGAPREDARLLACARWAHARLLAQ